MRGGDVVENQFIGPLLLVAIRLLDRIAGIDVIEELHALHHTAGIHIKAGNDAFGKHGKERHQGTEGRRHGGSRSGIGIFLRACSYRVTDGTRTRDVQDHNLALYQLSYSHQMTLYLLANWRQESMLRRAFAR